MEVFFSLQITGLASVLCVMGWGARSFPVLDALVVFTPKRRAPVSWLAVLSVSSTGDLSEWVFMENLYCQYLYTLHLDKEVFPMGDF